MSLQIEIRTATGQDIQAIASIEAQRFSEPWLPGSLEEARLRQDNIFLVADCGGQVAGYALLYGTLDEGEIPTIATHPDFAHMGVGTRLLQELLRECDNRGIARVFLEVRRSNIKAQGLYDKCNFEVVGRRKDFYRFPTEDALVMVCQVPGQQ